MADGQKIEQGSWGPENSGDQGVPAEGKAGGSSSVDETTGQVHNTDWSSSEPHEHHSWDERGSEVTNQHSTAGKGKRTS